MVSLDKKHAGLKYSVIIKTGIFVFWLVMVGLLIDRTYIRPASVIAIDAVAEEGVRTGDEWFGIYQQGRKIGYAHTRVMLAGDAYHIYEESELDILVLDTRQRVRTEINSYTTKNFLLKYFDFSMKSNVTDMKIRGAVVGRELVLDIETAGQIRKERVALAEPPYLSPNIKPSIILLGLDVGRKYRFPVFNPATMSTEDAFVTIEAKERIKTGDREQIIYRLKVKFHGMEAVSWITEDGETIKEESPLGYVLLKETAHEARKLDKEGPNTDIISLTMIPSDKIENPASTRFLKARLSGLSVNTFELSGSNQKMESDTIEVKAIQPTSSYRLPYTGTDMAEYLSPNAFVQADDRRIKKQAAKILGNEKDAIEAARKINEWVYNSIKKQPVVSIPSAIEVLNQRIGDCNEHTTLYTALARAAGIPTRIAAGIVYMKDGFYYHAWPEVWLGEWIPVDPTFNQFPADATHIRFVTGGLDRQSDILRLVGKLRIEILEYR